mgnify:CR=1 FL=1
MASDVSKAFADLAAAIRLRRVWMALAREDIGDQHRRTALGPLWLLLNYLAFAGTFIFVFHGDPDDTAYVPHVATGLFVWLYIMETVNNGVSLFFREESLIKGTVLPLTVYVMRLTMQSVLRSSYALVGCLVILGLAGTPVTPSWGWSVLGILLILAVTPAAVTVIAFLGAYFPDSQYIVSNLMRLGMFLTPVFWMYDGTEGGVRHAFYYWNPFTYFLEIVRIPVMTGEVPLRSLLGCAGIGVFLWALAILLLAQCRKKVVFVL